MSSKHLLNVESKHNNKTNFMKNKNKARTQWDAYESAKMDNHNGTKEVSKTPFAYLEIISDISFSSWIFVEKKC
jgi:hypothetical protein